MEPTKDNEEIFDNENVNENPEDFIALEYPVNSVADEKKIRKQEEKESVEKLGATAGRVAADYFTGGKYEQVRNKPIVGGVLKNAEKKIGKTISNSPGAKKIGSTAKKLDDAGAIDLANDVVGAVGGNFNPENIQMGKENSKSQNKSNLVNPSAENYNSGIPSTRARAKGVNSEDNNDLKSKIGKSNSFLNGTNNIKQDSNPSPNTPGLPKKDSLEEVSQKQKKSFKNTLDERVQNIAQAKAKKEINKVKSKLILKYVLPALGVVLGLIMGFLLFMLLAKQIISPITAMITFISEKFSKEEEGYTNEDAFTNTDDLYELFDKETLESDADFPDDPRELTTDEMFAYLIKYNPCNDRSLLDKIWDYLRPGLNSTCEVQNKIRSIVQKKEDELAREGVDVKISYGLLIGTLIQGYNYEREYITTLDENEEAIYNGKDEDGNIVNVYGEPAFFSQIIIDLMNNTNPRLKIDDIDKIIDNMIFHEGYTIYTYEVEEVDIYENGVVSGTAYYHKCSGKEIKDYYLDYQKYLIFLRYGEDKAKGYEKYYNLNKSWDRSSEQCKLTREYDESENETLIPVLPSDPKYDESNPNQTRRWIEKQVYMDSFRKANESFKVCGLRMTDFVDTSDLYEVADFDSDKIDILTNDYVEGFMAQKFGSINEESEDKTDRYFVKNLEKYIRDIIDYAIDMDETLGIGTKFMSSYFDSKGGLKPCYDFEEQMPYKPIGSGTCADVNDIFITTCRTTSATDFEPVNRFNTYKGGLVKWKTFNFVREVDTYKAKEPISYKDYVLGVTSVEIGDSYDIEAIKAFMVMLSSYAFSEKQIGGFTSIESDGMYISGDSHCFQAYVDYNKFMGSGSISKLEQAYEEAKDYMLFYKNSDKIFGINYVDVQQRKLDELAKANPNLTFKELLVHPDFIATSHSAETKKSCGCDPSASGYDYNYEDYEVRACKGSAAEVDGLIYYNQQEEPWASLDVCNDPGWPFRNQGCFVASIAMAAANLLGDSSITPDVANNKVCSGTMPTYALAHNLGVNASVGDISSAKSTMQNGGMVILQVRRGTFTSVDHYIVLAKTDGNKLYILDPYDSGNNGWSSNCTSCSIKGTEYTWDSIKEFVLGYTLVTR